MLILPCSNSDLGGTQLISIRSLEANELENRDPS